MKRKNVKYEHGAVDNAHLSHFVLNVPYLRRRHFAIEYAKLGSAFGAYRFQLCHLAASDDRSYIRLLSRLHKARRNNGSRSFRESFKLVKRCLALAVAHLRRLHAHKHRRAVLFFFCYVYFCHICSFLCVGKTEKKETGTSRHITAHNLSPHS